MNVYGTIHKSRRWGSIDRQHPGDPWCVWLTFAVETQVFLRCALVLMQEIAMEVNKMKRS